MLFNILVGNHDILVTQSRDSKHDFGHHHMTHTMPKRLCATEIFTMFPPYASEMPSIYSTGFKYITIWLNIILA